MNTNLSSSMVLSADQLKEKFLQCHVCFEEYDEEDKHPRLLPCLHTFCYQCVIKIFKEGHVECPECRVLHTVDHEDFRDIPKDNTRRDLMDFVRVQRAPTKVSCQACDTEGAMATHRCKVCAEFLCGECSNAHRRTNVTKGHEQLTLDELRSKQTLEAFCHPQKCDEHDDGLLNLYCSKLGCEKPICVNCALVTHKESSGHSIEGAKDVCKKKMQEIKSLMSDLDDTGMKVSQTTVKVKNEISNVTEKGKEIETEIDAAFDGYIRSLNIRREQMKQEASEKLASKNDTLETQKSKLAENKAKIDNALQFSEQSLAYTNPSAFLQIEKTIKTRLTKLLDDQFDDTPHEVASVGFSCTGMMTELQRASNTLTRVWNTSIYPPKTEIDTQGQATVKEVMTFYITLKDYNGRKSDDGLGKMTAVVTNPDNQGKDVETRARVDDPNVTSGGRFRVTFVPFTPGTHNLTVMVTDIAIGRLQFDVQACLEETVSKIDCAILKDVALTEFVFDQQRSHKDITVSPDGKTFLNSPTRVGGQHSNALQKYKGAMGNTPLTGPGCHYYEVNLRYTVRRPLEKSNLVFEIGVARRLSVDNKIHVDGQPFAWSIIGAHHNDCDAICLHIAHKNQCIFHERLSANEVDENVSKTFGFFLDTDKKEMKIFNGQEGVQVCLIDDVDYSEPLFPVVAGYNPYQIEVTMNLRTGRYLPVQGREDQEIDSKVTKQVQGGDDQGIDSKVTKQVQGRDDQGIDSKVTKQVELE